MNHALTNHPHVLLGWELSYFSGKVRSYLRFKEVPFVERPIDFFGFRFRAPRATGAAAIPIVITPEGTWLQDSSACRHGGGTARGVSAFCGAAWHVGSEGGAHH